MSVVVLYAQILTTLGALLALGVVTIVGRERMRRFARTSRSRLLQSAPHLGILVLVLLFSRIWRPIGRELSLFVGVNITHTLYSLEGDIVAQIQRIATTELTWVLSFVYVIGYGFLLLFPLVAYLFLDDLLALRVTILAYAINYLAGLFFYSVFVAFGPRNYMPGQVEELLYVVWPQIEFLTTDVNANTNVFPSLHTSVSVTVALLAWWTRDSYPRWLYVSAPLAACVIFSTMYLGLHWATDVVVGTVLGIASVGVAMWIAADETDNSFITRVGHGLMRWTHHSVARLRE
jgi:membrane-associated phospholipid phosphatase